MLERVAERGNSEGGGADDAIVAKIAWDLVVQQVSARPPCLVTPDPPRSSTPLCLVNITARAPTSHKAQPGCHRMHQWATVSSPRTGGERAHAHVCLVTARVRSLVCSLTHGLTFRSCTRIDASQGQALPMNMFMMWMSGSQVCSYFTRTPSAMPAMLQHLNIHVHLCSVQVQSR